MKLALCHSDIDGWVASPSCPEHNWWPQHRHLTVERASGQLDLRAPASCAWNLPPFGLSAKVQQELTVTWEAASLSLIGAISPMLQQQVSLEIATDVASSAIEYAFQRGEGGFGVI